MHPGEKRIMGGEEFERFGEADIAVDV